MAKSLQTSVILETSSAEAKLKKLAKAIDSVEQAIKKAGSATDKLEKGLQDSVNKTTKLKTGVKQVESAQKRVTNEVKRTHKAYKDTDAIVDSIFSKVKGLASAYLGIMGAQAVISTSDMITSSENKLNSINNGDTKATQAQMDAMYGAAQRSRTGYADMLANVSKSMTLSPDAFDGSMDKAIAFQEIMGKSYALGGASAAEQSSSMYQMIQALGSGKLAGDELRSVTEGAPLAAKQIEKFAQEVYKTDMALKDMGSKGMITSELVVDAMLNAGNTISDKFEDTSMTFAQAGTQLKNTITKAFEPVLQKLNYALNQLAENGFFDDLARGFAVLAQIAMVVANAFAWIAENWNWLKMIVIPLSIGVGFLAVALALWAIKAKIAAAMSALLGNTAFMAWLKVLLPIALVIAAIVAVIMILNACGISFADIAGFVVGVIAAAISIVWNLFLSLVALILKGVLLPIATAWDTFANLFGNIFNDPIAAIIRAFEGLAQSVLSILGTIARGIDAVFGSNLAAAVGNWSSGLSSKADALVNKYGNGSYETKSDAATRISSLIDSAHDKFTWNTADAYKSGFNWASNGVSSIGAGLTSKDWGSGASTDYDKLLGDIGGYSADTAGNTGKMADSMELAAEDLQLLYDLAEMEWKKEFTTANITVDMSNYNTINGTSDLDGIVTYLRDGLIEEMSAVSNGAYSFG